MHAPNRHRGRSPAIHALYRGGTPKRLGWQAFARHDEGGNRLTIVVYNDVWYGLQRLEKRRGNTPNH